ncbi:MAG: MarC family protein [Bacteroidetes bacterium]|nr:MarC family protein [Bacteroidota bacterium]
MLNHWHSFVNLLFIGVFALFPVVNPIGSAFMVNPYLGKLPERDRRNAIKKITLYAFFICIFSLFAGHYILKLFGISIPVIQIAGGIMICKMGWELLSGDKTENNSNTDPQQTVAENLFYPLTFPVTTGAGTISVVFTLSAHSSDADWKTYLVNTFAIVSAILIMCVLVYIAYINAKTLIRRLGDNGKKVINQISAFLIFCVGLQIFITGIKAVIQGH